MDVGTDQNVIKLINKGVNHGSRIILVNPLFRAFSTNHQLPATRAPQTNEALIPPSKSSETGNFL
jgi:hypothetical protein